MKTLREMMDLVESAQAGVAEGQGNLSKALDTLSGSWSGWHKEEDMSSPDIDVYEYDDGEGGYYGRGTIEHNLKTGEVKVKYHDSENEMDVDGTFKNMGDAMRALRGEHGVNHGGQAPNFDRLGQRKPHGPDDLRKTDRTGRKGTIGGGFANQLKGSIQANKGRLGPKAERDYENYKQGNVRANYKKGEGNVKEQDVVEFINPKDPQGDYRVKLKVLQQLSMTPGVDPKDVQQAMLDLKKQARDMGLAEDSNPEYNDEAGMAQSNLRTMSRAVAGLMDIIKDNDNLPEWAQEKIAKAEMMTTGVWDYLISQKEQGIDPQVEALEAQATGVEEADMQSSNTGYNNMLTVMKAVSAGQDATFNLGGEPITLEYHEARFLAGKYKAFLKAGRQTEFLQYMNNPVAFDRLMLQLRDLINKQKVFKGSIPGERDVETVESTGPAKMISRSGKDMDESVQSKGLKSLPAVNQNEYWCVNSKISKPIPEGYKKLSNGYLTRK